MGYTDARGNVSNLIVNGDYVYLGGQFAGTSAVFGASILTKTPDYGLLVARLAKDTGAWDWLDPEYMNIAGLAVTDENNIYYGIDSGLLRKISIDAGVAFTNTVGNWLSEIVVDSLGYYYITGAFTGTATIGTTTLTAPGQAGFLAKGDANGNWVWAIRTEADGVSSSTDRVLAVDSSNIISICMTNKGLLRNGTTAVNSFQEVFISGTLSSEITIGTTVIDTLDWDIFVAKLNAAGNAWDWVTFSQVEDTAYYIDSFVVAVDNNGDVYTTGEYGRPVTIGDVEFNMLPSVPTSFAYLLKIKG